jgi:hypothetical protein
MGGMHNDVQPQKSFSPINALDLTGVDREGLRPLSPVYGC